MAPARKRMKYDAGFKLKVVEFAKKTNNCAVAREFTISEKLVRDWRKAEVELRKMPKTKCARRGGKANWPELEDEVTDWVMENRQNGFPVTRNAIIIYALKWAKKKSRKESELQSHKQLVCQVHGEEGPCDAAEDKDRTKTPCRTGRKSHKFPALCN